MIPFAEYRGFIDPSEGPKVVRVVKGGETPLPLRLDLDNHSPSGFAWGYGGSGPAQLALALLADVLDDDERAIRLHEQFKWRAIAPLPMNEGWTISSDFVRGLAEQIEEEGA